MPATSTSVQPGLRHAGEPVISIAPEGALGLQSLAMLEGMLGTCAGSTVGGPAWASRRGDQTGAKLFAAPADLMNRVGDFVVLADGVRATVIHVESSDCLMAGPGAHFVTATRGTPGLRQAASAFPTLPESWAGAIKAAQRSGGRFLKPGAVARSSASSPASSAPPRTQASQAPVLDANELARRSAIVAKYGVASAEALALVNAKIARGDPA